MSETKRMSDEEFEAKSRLVLRGGAGSLTKLALDDEARRSRAREKRLEEALEAILKVDRVRLAFPVSGPLSASAGPQEWRRLVELARAALSEEP